MSAKPIPEDSPIQDSCNFCMTTHCITTSAKDDLARLRKIVEEIKNIVEPKMRDQLDSNFALDLICDALAKVKEIREADNGGR